MSLIDNQAENDLEVAFVKGREGKMTIEEIIQLLMTSKLYFPSTEKCSKNGLDIIPLIFDREGVPMASAFTTEDKMNYYSSYIKDAYLVPFKEIILKGGCEYGLVINPGYTVGLEIQPYGLENIRKNFLAAE